MKPLAAMGVAVQGNVMEPGSRLPGGELYPAGPSEIEVLLEAAGWHGAMRHPERIVRAAATAAMAEAGRTGLVSVLLADDHALKRLNSDHRGRVKATNVLSFPAGVPGILGDVALGLGTVRREARAGGRRVADHLAHLVAHGVLHLAGHDHVHAGQARRMEQAEARVMRRLGRPNPWRGTT